MIHVKHAFILFYRFHGGRHQEPEIDEVSQSLDAATLDLYYIYVILVKNISKELIIIGFLCLFILDAFIYHTLSPFLITNLK